MARLLNLWLKICFIEIRRIKEGRNIDLQALANLVDYTQLHRIIGTVDDVADGGLGYAAFDVKLILCHVPLA